MMRSTAMALMRNFKKHRLHKQIVVAMCLLFSTVLIFYFISPDDHEETMIVIREGPNYEDDYPQYPDEAGTIVKQDIIYNWDDWADGNVKLTLQDVKKTVEGEVTSEDKTSADKAMLLDKTSDNKAMPLDKTPDDKKTSLDETSNDNKAPENKPLSEALKRDPNPVVAPPERSALNKVDKSKISSQEKAQVTLNSDDGKKLQLAAPDKPDNRMR